MTVHLIAFTARGASLAARLCEALGPAAEAFAPERYCVPPVCPLEDSLAAWTARRFVSGEALVFIGAAGIAVRAVAPHVKGKDTDPAVVCVDEGGRYAIPLLSGHLGGANALARRLAGLCGGEAVITTATDRNGVFSADTWAAENGCAVADIVEIKHIAAALLDGETVGFRSTFPVAGALPDGVAETDDARCGIEIALVADKPYAHTLHLIPRCLVAGMGCRRGVDADTLERRLRGVLEAAGLPLAAVRSVATIDRKADEPGLLELCVRHRLGLLTYSAAELMAVEGDFTPSERVLRVTGADNVCERAAVLAGGRLLLPKDAGDGVTVAVARFDWTANFGVGEGCV